MSEIRKVKRFGRKSKVGRIIYGYKILKAISGIKSQRKKELIPCMVSRTGCEVHERQEIANTFADFYAGLYGDADREQSMGSHGIQAKIEEFTSRGGKWRPRSRCSKRTRRQTMPRCAQR